MNKYPCDTYQEWHQVELCRSMRLKLRNRISKYYFDHITDSTKNKRRFYALSYGASLCVLARIK